MINSINSINSIIKKTWRPIYTAIGRAGHTLDPRSLKMISTSRIGPNCCSEDEAKDGAQDRAKDRPESQGENQKMNQNE